MQENFNVLDLKTFVKPCLYDLLIFYFINYLEITIVYDSDIWHGRSLHGVDKQEGRGCKK